MKTYTFKIVTPMRCISEENVVKAIVRTTAGDIGIMADHIPYVSATKKGDIRLIFEDNSEKTLDCDSGIIKVGKDGVVILAQSVD